MYLPGVKKRNLILAVLVFFLLSCKVKRMAEKIPFGRDDVQGKLIVTFRDTSKTSEMEKRYRRQHLKVAFPLAEHLDIWLFRYDSTTIAPSRMAAKLLIKGYIRTVEFDKKMPTGNAD